MAAGAVREQVREIVAPALEAAGFDLEGLELARAGGRTVLRVLVDRDGGVDLEGLTTATRAVSLALDAADRVGSAGGPAGPYTLEVSSRGVDRPLVEPRHWRRAVGRLVTVRLADATRVSGRLVAAGETAATVETTGGPRLLAYAEVARAVVVVEFASDRP